MEARHTLIHSYSCRNLVTQSLRESDESDLSLFPCPSLQIHPFHHPFQQSFPGGGGIYPSPSLPIPMPFTPAASILSSVSSFTPNVSPYPSIFSPMIPQPFKLCFITGNISICTGCLRKYPKPSYPPYDIVIQHEEWRSFLAAGVPQSRFGNAYYHLSISCVQAKWPMFSPHNLEIPDYIISQLNNAHK